MVEDKVCGTQAGLQNAVALQDVGMQMGDKPKALFFEENYSEVLPHLQIGYVSFFHRLLRAHFKLEIVSWDCDYKEVVDHIQPDIVIFDGSFMGRTVVREIDVRNVPQIPDVPRVGLIRKDAGDRDVLRTLERLERLGVEALFSIDSGFGQIHGNLTERLYYLLWAVDTNHARDYGLEKDLLVSMTGYGYYTKGSYPWRQSIFPEVAANFPSFLSNRPHRSTKETLVGESYARILNRSKLSLGCGGHRRILVRKMLEIPACRSLLVTEETEITREAGFVDGENCIFADSVNIVEKLDHVLMDEERLDAMTSSGQALVESRHLIENRTQIADWLRLRRKGNGAGSIAQLSPFSGLGVEPTRGSGATVHLGSDCRVQQLYRQMDLALRAANYGEIDRLLGRFERYNKDSVDLSLARTLVAFAGKQYRKVVSELSRKLVGDYIEKRCSNPLALACLLFSIIESDTANRAIELARRIRPMDYPILQKIWERLSSLAQDQNLEPVEWGPMERGEWNSSLIYDVKLRAMREDEVIDRLFGSALEGVDSSNQIVKSELDSKGETRWAVLGTGEFGKKCYERYSSRMTIDCFFDSFPREEGTYCGLILWRPEEYPWDPELRVIVTNGMYWESVFQLLALGYDIENIRVLDRESMELLEVDPDTLKTVTP